MEKDWSQDIEHRVLLGITPGRRGILYHRLFSSQAPGFVSEPAEVQQALEKVSQALAPFKGQKTITWITDRGFDDVAAWRTIWEHNEHLVCRIYHTDRLVEVLGPDGQWVEPQSGTSAEAGTESRTGGNDDGGATRQATPSQAAASRSGDCCLSGSFDLFDGSATQGARTENHQDAVASASQRLGHHASPPSSYSLIGQLRTSRVHYASS